jgi:acyl carrier protein
VAQAVVTAFRDAADTARLIAYVVPDGELSLEALAAHARASLAEHMVPSRFVTLAALPKTATGQLDRRALPPPPEAMGTTAPPRTSTERELARIFGEVLDRQEIGLSDDFFTLGGHSLLAMLAISRIEAAFGLALPVRTLFENPTPGSLAIAVAEAQLAAVDPDRAERMLEELESLSDEAAESLTVLLAAGG